MQIGEADVIPIALMWGGFIEGANMKKVLFMILTVSFVSVGCWGFGGPESSFKKFVKKRDNEIRHSINVAHHRLTLDTGWCDRYEGVSSYKVYKSVQNPYHEYEGEVTYKCYVVPTIALEQRVWGDQEHTAHYSFSVHGDEKPKWRGGGGIND